jgi:hypothetical protein
MPLERDRKPSGRLSGRARQKYPNPNPNPDPRLLALLKTQLLGSDRSRLSWESWNKIPKVFGALAFLRRPGLIGISTQLSGAFSTQTSFPAIVLNWCQFAGKIAAAFLSGRLAEFSYSNGRDHSSVLRTGKILLYRAL